MKPVHNRGRGLYEKIRMRGAATVVAVLRLDVDMTLRPISSIDTETIGRALDLRGWRVISRDGAMLGTVSELLVDVEEGSPVYINIVPAFSDTHREQVDECWIRVPYRHASLDDAGRRVVLSDIATLGLGTATGGLVFSRNGARATSARRSEHAAPAEDEQQHRREQQLHAERDLESVAVMRERDVLEVHPVHSRNHHEGQAQRTDDRQSL